MLQLWVNSFLADTFLNFSYLYYIHDIQHVQNKSVSHFEQNIYILHGEITLSRLDKYSMHSYLPYIS